MNIKYLYKECCGCSACVQKCPKHCISLQEDTEGFLYPTVDEAACIDCGLCEKVCPQLGDSEKLAVQEVLAVKNPNEQERINSSSGGVFLPLAREIINKGGWFLALSLMTVGKFTMFMQKP